MNSIMTDFLKEASRIMLIVRQREQSLVTIVLLTDDDTVKLKNIKLTLLNLKLEKGDMESNLKYDDLFNNRTTNQLNAVADLMNKTYSPFIEQQKKFDKIGDVCRSNVSDKDKVEQITNLLI